MSDHESFFAAIRSGDLHQLRTLLKADLQLAEARHESGVSGLMMAKYCGRSDIVAFLLPLRGELDFFECAALGQCDRLSALLARDPSLLNGAAPDGFSALGLAAFFGQRDVLDALLSRGADPNVASSNAMQVRPIHSAAAHREPRAALAMVESLIAAGADPNVAQPGGWTPLHQSAAHGNRDLVEHLLAHGANRHARSEDGRTALDMAKEKEYQEVIRLFERG
jgi:ankyrin repeat protein